MLSTTVKEKLLKLKMSLVPKFEGESISDRKLMKIIHVLKISAYFHGRQTVENQDLVVLPNCLWNKEENRVELSKAVESLYK